MRTWVLLIVVVIWIGCGESTTESDHRKPNIVYILADDLGYGDLGVYGQSTIETPHIDALAAAGKRYTQFYSSAPVCAPARCMLLTGQDAGHAYIRGNDEWGARGDVWSYEAMNADSSLEGQRPLPDSIFTVAEYLQQRGYRTGIFGKWGLGAPGSEGVPNRQGFDTFFGYNCQRQAHTYFPRHLWDNDQKYNLENPSLAPHTPLDPAADSTDKSTYDAFQLTDYAPDLMHQRALEFIEESDSSFFLYYASPVPHVPLQAPEKWVEYYRQKIGSESPYTGKNYFPSFAPRATYAAMISYLDEQVGELIVALKEKGVWENTILFFTSDNGPTFTGGVDADYFNSAGPFSEDYGRTKGFVHEGGIRVPMIVCWPGKIAPNSISDHISIGYDLFPTVLDLIPSELQIGLDGVSMLPDLLDAAEIPEHPFLYWEFPSYGGQQAVRIGPWKGIRKNILKGNLKIELYNLEEDPQEEHDIADKHAYQVNEIKKVMDQHRVSPQIDRFKMEALGDR